MGASALVLCGHRYYDPHTGRWLTRDPIGYAGGVNLYAYCTNNPVNYADPMGLCGEGSDEVADTPNKNWSFYRLFYTGDPHAPDSVYDAAIDSSREWVFNKCAVRGVYVSMGTRYGQDVWGGPSASTTWTVDSGFGVGTNFVAGADNIFGVGGGVGYSEDGGWKPSFRLSRGPFQYSISDPAKSGTQTIRLGIPIGYGASVGFLLDPAKLIEGLQ